MYFFVAKLLSIAVTTYSYVFLSHQKPTCDDPAKFLWWAPKDASVV